LTNSDLPWQSLTQKINKIKIVLRFAKLWHKSGNIAKAIIVMSKFQTQNRIPKLLNSIFNYQKFRNFLE